jgi:hypothetical protein
MYPLFIPIEGIIRAGIRFRSIQKHLSGKMRHNYPKKACLPQSECTSTNSADNSIIFQLKKGNTQGKQLHRCVIGVGSIFGNPDLLLITIQLYYIQRVIRWNGAAQ